MDHSIDTMTIQQDSDSLGHWPDETALPIGAHLEEWKRRVDGTRAI